MSARWEADSVCISIWEGFASREMSLSETIIAVHCLCSSLSSAPGDSVGPSANLIIYVTKERVAQKLVGFRPACRIDLQHIVQQIAKITVS